jgi:hypothetical protein
MQHITEKQQRQRVMQQFEMQVRKLTGYSIAQRLTNYRYVLHDALQQRDRRAMVLFTSWGYYEHWLHRGKWSVDLLIVHQHTAVVPCYVLELSTGIEHRPGKIPELERKDRKRRNRAEVMLFVSQLLMDMDAAHQELRQMKPRTRRYYQALCNEYARPARGRPWAS